MAAQFYQSGHAFNEYEDHSYGPNITFDFTPHHTLWPGHCATEQLANDWKRWVEAWTSRNHPEMSFDKLDEKGHTLRYRLVVFHDESQIQEKRIEREFREQMEAVGLLPSGGWKVWTFEVTLHPRTRETAPPRSG